MTTAEATKAPILVESMGAHATLLRAAFNLVCDPADWKGPVNCLVPWESANVYMEAIEFMTATKPLFERVVKDGTVYAQLSSVGYRAGPAGDH